MDQQATADSDIKLTSVGETAATRFEFHEGCLGDDAGFSGPNVESATDAIDSVVNEDSISPGQISNDGGDFACDGNDDDDFRGFASFDEAMPSTTEHGDVGPNDFEPADAQSDDEEADIGGAASFKDKSCLASTDIVDKYDEDTQSNEDQSSVQKWGGVAPLGDGFSCSEDSKHQNQIKPGSGGDDDFGDLRDVEEVRTLPINQIETEEVLQGKNQQEGVTTVNSMNDEDFGDFGEFEEVPPTLMNENETEQIAQAENQPEPAMGISSIDDDDFGDFGDFEGMQSTLMNDSGAEEFAECKNHPDPASGMSSLGDDDFGDFGNFEEVSSKPINQQDIENSSTACLSKQINQDPEKQPDMTPGISPFDDDDFGDFEEVSSAITDQMLDGKTTESVPTLPVTVLDESVRAMFQTVFATDGRVQLNLDGKESAEFPFDVSLRSVLPNEPTMEETTEEICTHSEEALAKMIRFLAGLPMSAPMAILSHDRWYPYSHYTFNIDGTPMIESCEPVSSTPSVPDVLCIDLPTGFDASEFSKPANGQLAEVSISKQMPTDAALPDTYYHEDKKTERLFDESQLSPAGKKFLDQIPDLSYMLSSSLRLPNN